ncbi:MAG: phosphoribosylformylglycinamidine synthase subunit PurS [Phycisphaerae bacterium]|jgi:phosphoribosylformylglycinamidine synthase II|nr:phosphoribosylformylglycinamidine synthase subunit PurS [Phycisphaerae bacterium]
MPDTATPSRSALKVHRIEVRPRRGQADPRGASVLRQIETLGLERRPKRVDYAAVYLLEGDLTSDEVHRIADELLADCVTQAAEIHPTDAAAKARVSPGVAVIEVHPLPGVTDPAAESVQLAIEAMLGKCVSVLTGDRYDLHGVEPKIARAIAERLLANTVIHDIHDAPYLPASFPHGRPYTLTIREVAICGLSDAELERMSRDAHLFLSLDEMKAIQAEYKRLGREPREIELETLAQTWSEHCVHKTLKSTIRYRELSGAPGSGGWSLAKSASGRPHHEPQSDGTVVIRNLLKATVAAATHELMADGIDWCLSVFVDNAGVIAFDGDWAVCFKCETHNHPSAIEPYGGSATGIGGCIRDIMGTGLSAKPIAATDVFCVAYPEIEELPAGCLHPRRVLSQVVAGVRDYGNRMGIPTLNGTVWFDNNYVGNPLVYCGCIGLLPKHLVRGEVKRGDRIIAIGGRTGRDGIHGATFSSAELTDTHADEFSHAVQIGNAITEKKALDCIIAARDHAGGPLFSAITDCGAGGFSSAVGEMGKDCGAEVHLERAPLKYNGLSPVEVWISEAQERMVLAVPADKVELLGRICADHCVEWCDLGTFGTPTDELVLIWHGTEVGRMDTHFLHDGNPMPTREAVWDPTFTAGQRFQPPKPQFAAGGRFGLSERSADIAKALEALLEHPNIASKAWIVRQYDHEVQGMSVVKPLVGPHAGPGDAAVIQPVPTSQKGLAIGNGLATGLSADPYLMVLAAIDECVRNLVCVGTDPTRIAILDNFCWPSCKDPRNLGSLVRAAEACYDGAKAYRTPFISGKDSLNNQFVTDGGVTIQIPPTLLVSGFGIVQEIERAMTMDAKRAGNLLVLVGSTHGRMGGSQFQIITGQAGGELPVTDLTVGPRTAKAVSEAIRSGVAVSAHDLSEGGLLVAAAEMAFAGGLGLDLDPTKAADGDVELHAKCFSEEPSRYLLEVAPTDRERIAKVLMGLPYAIVGTFTERPSLAIRLGNDVTEIPIDRLRERWSGSNW